jgi:hypothetical protein
MNATPGQLENEKVLIVRNEFLLLSQLSSCVRL